MRLVVHSCSYLVKRGDAAVYVSLKAALLSGFQMDAVEISDVWDCMLELFDFPGCAQRRSVVSNVVLFNNFLRMEQLRNAADASTWEGAERLQPNEITFLNGLAALVKDAHTGRYHQSQAYVSQISAQCVVAAMNANAAKILCDSLK